VKPNYKIKIFAVLALLNMAILLPAFVFAQDQLKPDGSSCTNPGAADATCESGYCTTSEQCGIENCKAGTHWDSESFQCVLNPVGAPTTPNTGNLCANKVCDSGTVCSPTNGQCVPLVNSQNTNPTAAPPVGGPALCGGDQNLVFQNGVCLPKDLKCTTGFCGVSTLSDLLLLVIKTLLFFSGLVAVVMVIIGGYWYMAAGGNEEQAEKGKNTIINFVLGLIIIIMGYTIVTIVTNTLTK